MGLMLELFHGGERTTWESEAVWCTGIARVPLGLSLVFQP